MTEDREERDFPTTNHPLHGEPRSRVKPAFVVLGIFVVIAAVFVVITVLRYTT